MASETASLDEETRKRRQHFERIQVTLDKYSHSHLYKEEIIDLAGGVGPGMRVVDIGCGGRGLSVIAAERGAHITATDGAASAIKLITERLKPFRHYDIVQTKMENLDLPDQSFDVVFGLLSIWLCSDYRQAMRELARIARPGGRVIVQSPTEVWAMGHMPTFMRAYQAALKPEPRDPPENFVVFSDPDKIRTLFSETGLIDIEVHEVTRDWTGPTIESWKGDEGDLLLGLSATYYNLSRQDQLRIKQTFVDMVDKDFAKTSDGRCIIPNPTWVAIGRKPTDGNARM